MTTTHDQAQAAIDALRALLASWPDDAIVLRAESAAALVDGWERLEEERDRLRAALAGVVFFRYLDGVWYCDYCGQEEGFGRPDCVCAALAAGDTPEAAQQAGLAELQAKHGLTE